MESQSKPILVIGDTCADVFVYCHCERLCPEAPVPVLDIVNQCESLGMAGNVHRNIEALGYPARLVCNVGYGDITKTRYVDTKTNHMFLRIDSKAVYVRVAYELLERHISAAHYAAVVISDYNKGFLTQEDIQFIAEHHPLTFLDTKKRLGSWAKDIRFIKINRSEFAASEPFLDDELRANLIVTLGSEGCRYRSIDYPVNDVEIKNLSGAGDSFLAGLVVEYLQTGGDIAKALTAANKVASIVVQKKGVSTIKD